MDCDVYRDLLLDFVNGALAGQERAALEDHLADCGPCREAVALERRLDESLSRRLVAVPPDGFTGRVLSCVRDERSVGRVPGRVLQLAAYAASLAALLTGFRQGLPEQWHALRELASTRLAEASPPLSDILNPGNGFRTWLDGLTADIGAWLSEPLTLEMVRSTGLMGLGIGAAVISVLWASYLILLDSEPAE